MYLLEYLSYHGSHLLCVCVGYVTASQPTWAALGSHSLRNAVCSSCRITQYLSYVDDSLLPGAARQRVSPLTYITVIQSGLRISGPVRPVLPKCCCDNTTTATNHHTITSDHRISPHLEK